VKITFLGTSSGKTTLNRYHSSLLFNFENYNLLIDAGDGVSRALLGNGIEFNSVNGILFTHLHPDHFSGFPALIVQMKMTNRDQPLDIFIHESLKTVVEEFMLHSYLIAERMEFQILYKTFSDNSKFIITEDLTFLARKNSHLSELENYKSNHPTLSLYSAGFLFEVGKKKIIYTSDVGSEKDIFLFKDFLPDIFISELTHISASSVIESVSKNEHCKIYFTHYPDEAIGTISEILANLPDGLKERVKLAEDGLSVEI
jgi:ribonuclease Z